MKKFLLGFAMLLTVGSSFAQDDVTAALRFDETSFDMKPGDIAVVNVFLDCNKTKAFSALQFRLYLPAGVKPAPINYEEAWEEYQADVDAYIEDGEDPSELNIEDYYVYQELGGFSNNKEFTLANKFLNWNETESGMNEFRFVMVSLSASTFPAKATDKKQPLITFAFTTTDSCQTGKYDLDVKAITFNKADNTEFTLDNFTAADLTYSIKYIIGESGFATLCWPVSLDFTTNDFKAYIGSNISSTSAGTFMSRTQVNKVIGKTPVIIEGTPGTYDLTTTLAEDLDDVKDNVLEGTPSAPLKVTSDNIYALASKPAGVGFYRVKNDAENPVEIAQYKAYYTATSAGIAAYLFEETTGIDQLALDNEDGEVYTISGMKVSKANKKGVYIINGKKVVIK